MITTQTTSIASRLGGTIPVAIDYREGLAKCPPVVLILHGFKGFASWGFFPHVASTLAEAGYVAVRINFSHNGVEGMSGDATRLDLFELNTFSREVAETRQVVEAIASGDLLNDLIGEVGPLALLGHSRGGGIAPLAAVDSPDVEALVTWSAVSTFDRYSDRQKERWRRDGFLEAKNARTGQIMRLGKELLEELEREPENLDICNAVRRLNRPLLLVHGEVDLSVTVENARRLYDCSDPEQTEIALIPRTGHTFGAVHPFAGVTPALGEAFRTTLTFFGRHLRRSP